MFLSNQKVQESYNKLQPCIMNEASLSLSSKSKRVTRIHHNFSSMKAQYHPIFPYYVHELMLISYD